MCTCLDCTHASQPHLSSLLLPFSVSLLPPTHTPPPPTPPPSPHHHPTPPHSFPPHTPLPPSSPLVRDGWPPDPQPARTGWGVGRGSGLRRALLPHNPTAGGQEEGRGGEGGSGAGGRSSRVGRAGAAQQPQWLTYWNRRSGKTAWHTPEGIRVVWVGEKSAKGEGLPLAQGHPCQLLPPPSSSSRVMGVGVRGLASAHTILGATQLSFSTGPSFLAGHVSVKLAEYANLDSLGDDFPNICSIQSMPGSTLDTFHATVGRLRNWTLFPRALCAWQAPSSVRDACAGIGKCWRIQRCWLAVDTCCATVYGALVLNLKDFRREGGLSQGMPL